MKLKSQFLNNEASESVSKFNSINVDPPAIETIGNSLPEERARSQTPSCDISHGKHRLGKLLQCSHLSHTRRVAPALQSYAQSCANTAVTGEELRQHLSHHCSHTHRVSPTLIIGVELHQHSVIGVELRQHSVIGVELSQHSVIGVELRQYYKKNYQNFDLCCLKKSKFCLTKTGTKVKHHKCHTF